MPLSVPDFDDLPKVEGMPQGCAWGVFDQNGEKDVHGTLNFLTPDVVQAAAAEVKEGVSISLNWPINALRNLPLPGRGPAKHRILYVPESMGFAEMGVVDGPDSWDDELEFNTQAGSQWDSLCHYLHRDTNLAYNGTKPTRELLSVESTSDNKLPTLDHWHSRGGLVARGVLIDYKAYAEAKSIPFSILQAHRITVQDIEACASFQGVEFRQGDVLIVRTGATELYENPAPELLQEMAKGEIAGLHGSEETARWIWNRRFSAVAGDSIALEALPPVDEDGTPGSMAKLVLHSYLLSCFGMSIGELWDLSRLSAYCKEKKRYSFMLTSSPLNQPGLVGSPPNALAIF